jgi:hypothetical protein
LNTEAILQCEWINGDWLWHGEGEVLPGVVLPDGKYRLDFPENPPYADLYGKGLISLNVNISKYVEGQEDFCIMGDGDAYHTPNPS